MCTPRRDRPGRGRHAVGMLPLRPALYRLGTVDVLYDFSLVAGVGPGRVRMTFNLWMRVGGGGDGSGGSCFCQWDGS